MGGLGLNVRVDGFVKGSVYLLWDFAVSLMFVPDFGTPTYEARRGNKGKLHGVFDFLGSRIITFKYLTYSHHHGISEHGNDQPNT